MKARIDGAARATLKRSVAWCLRRLPPARWLFELAVRLIAPRQRVGVLALIVREGDGAVLVGRHVFRPRAPWGVPGGWVERGEDPEAALVRELREELGARAVHVHSLLLAAQEGEGGEPPGIGLVYACTIEDERFATARLPFELLELRWAPPEAARALLRPIELRALDLHRSGSRSADAGVGGVERR